MNTIKDIYQRTTYHYYQ